MQAYIGFRSSIWSFNPVVAAWEPVMEPWDIILKLDVNPTPLVKHPAGSIGSNVIGQTRAHANMKPAQQHDTTVLAQIAHS